MTLAGLTEGFGAWKPPENIFEKVSLPSACACEAVLRRDYHVASSAAEHARLRCAFAEAFRTRTLTRCLPSSLRSAASHRRLPCQPHCMLPSQHDIVQTSHQATSRQQHDDREEAAYARMVFGGANSKQLAQRMRRNVGKSRSLQAQNGGGGFGHICRNFSIQNKTLYFSCAAA